MGDSNAKVPISQFDSIISDPTADSLALRALHRQFLQNLTLLKQAGEAVAAAHLAAAIDALEARHGILDGDGRALHEETRLQRFVDGLVVRLGDRALDVARQQSSDASGDALAAWTAITNRIAAKRR